jgi:hypothetical protein
MNYETEVVRALRDDAFRYGSEADGLLEMADALEGASLISMREKNVAKAAEFERQAAQARSVAVMKEALREHAWDASDTMVINAAAAELIRETPGAEYIDDVGRIRGRRWTELLAERTNIPWPRVGHLVYEQTRQFGLRAGSDE